MPSETPSCTPSNAPTPAPSINLFYPDQTGTGMEQGCLNDGAQPGWMDANANIWLSTTLDKCCTRHFSWNYAYCMSSGSDNTCARAYWYVLDFCPLEMSHIISDPDTSCIYSAGIPTGKDRGQVAFGMVTSPYVSHVAGRWRKFSTLSILTFAASNAIPFQYICYM